MSGALLQMVSLGEQDKYLTGTPKITLFKKKINSYTNFSTGTIQINFDGNIVNFGGNFDGGKKTATITSDIGDLLHRLTLVLKLEENTSKSWGYVNKIGHAIIDNIEVMINSELIDIHEGEFINMYNELNRNDSHDDNYDKMIGNVDGLKNIDVDHDEYTLYIPLNFWFTKSTVLSFPLCSIDGNIQINVTLNHALDCINWKGTNEPSDNLPNIISSYLLADLIFLDEEEKRYFETDPNIEYLIETVDEITDHITTQDFRHNLTFQNSCKYIMWATNLNRYYNRNKFLSFAFDDNFDKALDNFGKLIWLSTRDGLDMSKKNPIIRFSSNFINIGEVPAMISGGNTILESLSKKVKGIILFAETLNNEITAKATIDNVILSENNLTFEDMSKTIDEIKEGLNTTDDQTAFLNKHTLNIRDVFNFGNFINRTDNPIVSSRLILNGYDKFQERDGNFFNSIVPYYHFSNKPADGINVFSFSVDPNNLDPLGTINFGAIGDNQELILNIGKNNIKNNEHLNGFYKNGKDGCLLRVFSYNYSFLKVFNKGIILR